MSLFRAVVGDIIFSEKYQTTLFWLVTSDNGGDLECAKKFGRKSARRKRQSCSIVAFAGDLSLAFPRGGFTVAPPSGNFHSLRITKTQKGSGHFDGLAGWIVGKAGKANSTGKSES